MMLMRELNDLLDPTIPAGVVADLGPGQTGFQQVHIRIGLEQIWRRIAREKAASPKMPPLFDEVAYLDRAPLHWLKVA
jgi:hypothetical protein